MKFQDLRITENPTLVRDHALDKLREAISSGLYPPGTRLIERELCDALGVSRTSVREALRQLQSEHLIEVGARRNIRVAVVTAEEADDIYFVRIQLEAEAARRFAERRDDKAFKRLLQVHKDMHKQIHKRNAPQLSVLAGEFYQTILQGCGSIVIYDLARRLLARVQYLRMKSMSEPGRLDGGMAEWDRLVEAISSGDGPAAARAMTEHLSNARAAVAAAIQHDAPDE